MGEERSRVGSGDPRAGNTASDKVGSCVFAIEWPFTMT